MADIGNTATEFAGVAGSMMIFGVSKYISVPLAAVGVWILVVKGTYRTAERIFLVFSLFLLSYVVSAVLAKPDWGEIGQALVRPAFQFDRAYLGMVIGIIGTTIAPWMQFYMQSAVIEKRIKIEDYRFAVWDVVIGCVATVVVAFFIIVACASTLHEKGIVIQRGQGRRHGAEAAGRGFAAHIFAFGLFIASIFSATILPLATSFYVCEAFGFEAGIDKKLQEAPQFYGLFTAIITIGVLIILIPGAPLIAITIWTQVINGILLPVVLICMMIMINKREIMGTYVNNAFQNFVGWGTSALLIFLTFFMVIAPLVTRLFRK